MGVIETIFYAPTAWCTLIPEEWTVNHLDIIIVSAFEENGGIGFTKGGERIMSGFWYEGLKCIRKSQLIGMCLTDFVYKAAEKGILPT